MSQCKPDCMPGLDALCRIAGVDFDAIGAADREAFKRTAFAKVARLHVQRNGVVVPVHCPACMMVNGVQLGMLVDYKLRGVFPARRDHGTDGSTQGSEVDHQQGQASAGGQA